MPVFLFTYHAYGTWMPDRTQAYVRRYEGILPTSNETAKLYRDQMKQSTVSFCEVTQQHIIETTLATQPHLDITLRMIATDPTHIHTLIQWGRGRDWKKLRQSIKTAISITLNKHRKPQWLSGGASGKRVKDESHLHHLETQYLPEHRGWKWSPDKGNFK